MREATFVTRADSTELGELRGPFEGRVVDAATGQPLSGALVSGYWRLRDARDTALPLGGEEKLAETNSDGRYTVPSLSRVPRGALVDGFVLIVYKNDYVAYRSDRRFEDLSTRRDFSQRGNIVRLDRFRASDSRAAHLRFVGGTPTVRRALAREISEASLELEGTQRADAPAPERTLDASALLAPAELAQLTGYTGTFVAKKLADQAATTRYDSVHWKAVDHPERYDAALRLWRLETQEAAKDQFETLFSEIPGAERAIALERTALWGQTPDVLALAVIDPVHRAVVALTCGRDQCKDRDVALRIMQAALAHLPGATGASP